jgi:hypothetical protein
MIVGVPLLILDFEALAQGGLALLEWEGSSTFTLPDTNVGMYCVKRMPPMNFEEPRPDRIAIELAEKGRMMKADPSAAPLFDVFLQRRTSAAAGFQA